ncbi:type II toxin-antitoxin system RelE/ParE family toxin [Vallitalea maricola]|uniref:Uncharacterized protein n=1 Tax=Vallitalea maricola TaxID=3074433 RepID=A0ACB5UP16_9FIRM|nr:hypothetical protein AN2V17_38450 [Vallitalea sp. AN17-2]
MDNYRVIITEKAIKDIMEISEYISITFFLKGIRRIIVGNYIIFYICLDKDLLVSVIRVLYNKRDWKNII